MPFAEYALDELFDSELYRRLAGIEKNPANREILEKLSQQERSHYEFWSRFSGSVELGRWDRLKLAFLVLSSRILGKVFIIKFLERHEGRVVEEYVRVLESAGLSEEQREALKGIIEDEKYHEEALASQIDEFAVRHLGAMALGMSDAIIELSGVHAGFLGYTSSPIYTGISGLIVGISASMSMAAAAYLQAKQEKGKSPAVNALVTGLMYMLTVVMLTSPFFLVPSVATALAASVALAVAALAAFSYFSSVILGGNFLREFLENTSIVFLVVLVGYLFGSLVERVFGFRP
ncbi:VIT1/CCC1 transporter family protein [Thermofilum pendens]|uniref:Uncharacterized protein n=1 Tax=Thermofilum pendens (strain DSM 2475 / Hrk 5) TaxID=368408 RepID=A1S0R5_THEPD|nr:VIT1/CCC1 family protein [Thermofilum pendens]ABL79045.1 protein of unknown function DUF125, transmembrane [Thermofilum pendens Hrk 5]